MEAWPVISNRSQQLVRSLSTMCHASAKKPFPIGISVGSIYNTLHDIELFFIGGTEKITTSGLPQLRKIKLYSIESVIYRAIYLPQAGPALCPILRSIEAFLQAKVASRSVLADQITDWQGKFPILSLRY